MANQWSLLALSPTQVTIYSEGIFLIELRLDLDVDLYFSNVNFFYTEIKIFKTKSNFVSHIIKYFYTIFYRTKWTFYCYPIDYAVTLLCRHLWMSLKVRDIINECPPLTCPIPIEIRRKAELVRLRWQTSGAETLRTPKGSLAEIRATSFDLITKLKYDVEKIGNWMQGDLSTVTIWIKLMWIIWPGIAIRLKFADSSIIGVWTYKKLPRIIRFQPDSNTNC